MSESQTTDSLPTCVERINRIGWVCAPKVASERYNSVSNSGQGKLRFQVFPNYFGVADEAYLRASGLKIEEVSLPAEERCLHTVDYVKAFNTKDIITSEKFVAPNVTFKEVTNRSLETGQLEKCGYFHINAGAWEEVPCIQRQNEASDGSKEWLQECDDRMKVTEAISLTLLEARDCSLTTKIKSSSSTQTQQIQEEEGAAYLRSLGKVILAAAGSNMFALNDGMKLLSSQRHEANKISYSGNSIQQELKASTKAAAKTLICLLEERVTFHAALQEALGQGNMNTLRLQELLDLEKLRHDLSKKDIEKVQKSFGLFWNTGVEPNAMEITEDKLCQEELELMKIQGDTATLVVNDNRSHFEFSQLTDRVNIDEMDLIDMFYCQDKNIKDQTAVSALGSSMRVQTRTRVEFLQLLEVQESHFRNAKDAVENLERKLTLIEHEKLKLEELVERIRSDAILNINAEDVLNKLERTLSEEDLARQFSCIYVSPVFEDRKAYRSKAGHDKSGQQQKATSEHLDHQKDLEIKELKTEMQNLRNEVRMRRKTGILAEKMPKSNLGGHDEGHLVNTHRTLSLGTSVNERWNLDPHFPQLSMNDCAPNGFMKVMKEKLAADAQRENPGPFLSGADHCEKLIVPVKISLEELNQELQNQISFASEETESTWKKQVADAVAESENLKTLLESLRKDLEEEVEKNKMLLEKIGDQEKHLANIMEEHQIELERKERTFFFAQQLNSQLTNDMSKTETSLAELRSHYKGLVASLENQLNDAKNDLEGLQVTADQLAQQLANSEARILDLELALNEKDKHMEELKRRMLAIQNETDATVMEKFELVTKTQDIRKDCDETKVKLKELVSINEELLRFAQAKEEQLASLNQEAVHLLRIVKVTTDENGKLKQELEGTQKEIKILREEDEAFKHRYKFMKAKLYETEYELTQREEALERLTKHLAALIDGNDCGSEEVEQLKASLVYTNFKEGKLGEQLKQSRIIVGDLEEKMVCMEAEVSKARREMASIKEENSKAKRAKEGQQEGDELRQHQVDGLLERGMLKVSFPMELQPTY